LEKVVIVGAGPAGLFAADELISDAYNVTVIDKRRKVGGSGLQIDGKFNFHSKIGFWERGLTEFLPEKEANETLNHIDDTFREYAQPDEYSDPEKMEKIKIKASQAGIEFIPIKQTHIGSDRLPESIEKFMKNLENRGVKFQLATEAKDLKLKDNRISEIITDRGNFKSDYVLLAPGRPGHSWLKEQCDKLGLNVYFNPLDVGLRVEVLNDVFKDIVENYKIHDPKFHINTTTNDDFVRTFCVCFGGYVTSEKYTTPYGILYGVNGHSHSRFGRQSDNTNFALLTRIHLTEPVVDTTLYGYGIAFLSTTIGEKKPLIQRVGDLKDNRRSTWSRIYRSNVKPTLNEDDATPGDIRMVLPYKIVQDMTEGLEMLEKVIPGVYTKHTLLYGPEIKHYSRKVETNGLLQSKIPNLYFAGDGAGVSRGIVAAAATGIVAAKGIKTSV
jgi:uncharacterized FAD-dependent dehydrogenase